VFPYLPFPLPEEPPADGRPLASPPGEADARLALVVAERLRRRLGPGAYRIVVEVQNRVVVIDGTVAVRPAVAGHRRGLGHTGRVRRLEPAARDRGDLSAWRT
jgi:hypothetical protein